MFKYLFSLLFVFEANSYTGKAQGLVHVIPVGGKTSVVIEGAGATDIFNSLKSVPLKMIQYGIESKLGKNGKSITCFELGYKKHICYLSLLSNGLE